VKPNLDKPVVLITGAASGIGRAGAYAFVADEGGPAVPSPPSGL
jgi:NAD(P)-dependent dehydrogenase (short-subunit alcohol dehydrogenase family)